MRERKFQKLEGKYEGSNMLSRSGAVESCVYVEGRSQQERVREKQANFYVEPWKGLEQETPRTAEGKGAEQG